MALILLIAFISLTISQVTYARFIGGNAFLGRQLPFGFGAGFGFGHPYPHFGGGGFGPFGGAGFGSPFGFSKSIIYTSSSYSPWLLKVEVKCASI